MGFVFIICHVGDAKTEFNWVLAFDDGKVIDVTDTYDTRSIEEREKSRAELQAKRP